MAGLTGRKLIASRCAKFFKDGDFVNLGIGVPLMCVNYLPEGVDLWLEAEIGTVGSGPTPSWDEGTEKVDYTVYIWYNVSIKYRRCFYDRTTAEIDAKSIHGNI